MTIEAALVAAVVAVLVSFARWVQDRTRLANVRLEMETEAERREGEMQKRMEAFALDIAGKERRERERLTEQVSSLRDDLAKAQANERAALAEAAQLKARVDGLNVQVERMTQQTNQQLQQIGELRGKLDSQVRHEATEVAKFEKRVRDLEDDLAMKSKTQADALMALDAERSAAQIKDKQLAEMHAERTELQISQKLLREEVDKLRSENAALHNEVNRLSRQVVELGDQMEQMRQQLAERKAEPKPE